VELVYTRDLKSLARNGIMGSSPIGATTMPIPRSAAKLHPPSSAGRHLLLEYIELAHRFLLIRSEDAQNVSHTPSKRIGAGGIFIKGQ
jgi:hypothetical protein